MAFVIAPPAGLAAYLVIYLLVASMKSVLAQSASALAGAMFYSMVAIVMGPVLAFIGFAIVGFPSWLLLRSLKAESGYAYALIGLVGGWHIPAAKINGFTLLGEPVALHNALAGCLVMLFFWRIARAKSEACEDSNAN
ncbi:CBS-domain-containing membrane protein [Sphingobium sp. B1D7B]|uniref:hypothetical protein n=1 Tax=unclassified Sphingobium TaxID=2611147 RepID=UPI00222508F0|nr:MULTISPECIES: hypothetical protein [unclassified Sphingobium]MCW2395158.1 CBS-domain-containing membrane protein [Sphingobium sp. B8D3B]MCW2405284.1 CBS-domain-containing membrane protein [Sphingobium sp. B1D7B]MCW2418672.1 CBS-domain-containing membrane protein [Sphingobium sp. B8D3C]